MTCILATVQSIATMFQTGRICRVMAPTILSRWGVISR
jgi:hypothetical protein